MPGSLTGGARGSSRAHIADQMGSAGRDVHGEAAIRGDVTVCPRVVYVVGTGRSGSTIFSNVLGEAPGAVSLGEVRYFWERGVHQNWACGCGEKFDGCPFWAQVVKALPAEMCTEAFAERIVWLDARLLRVRRLPELLWRLRRERHGTVMPELTELRRAYGQLYTALTRVTESVVVDSSKLLPHALVLANDPRLDVYFLHFVRDPRGAAFSWGKRINRADGGDTERAMGREGPLKSALLWLLWNALIPILLPRGRVLTVRYEDFIDDPAPTMHRITAWIGMTGAAASVTGPEVSLGVNHTVAGNPNRLRTGAVRLSRDERWRRDMPRATQLLVTMMTFPLLRRLRYPVRSW